MAAENTLLFSASAIRCSSQFHLQNPDLFKGMMDELVMLGSLPFLMFFFFFFFFPSIEDWSSALASALRQIPPLLCSLFQITLKADASFGQSPLALGFCAAVRVRSYDLWFADDMNNASLVAVEAVLQSTSSNVRFDCPSLLIDWFSW